MNIVYVIEALFLRGGIERIISDKANYLSDHFGYNVSIISCVQRPDQSNAFHLSSKVKQYYLNVPYYSQYNYKYPKRFWLKYKIKKELRKKIKKQILEIKPNIIIGMGQFLGDLVCSINYNAIKIIESHEARCFTDSNFGKHQSFIINCLATFSRKRYFKTIEKNADIIVTLTKEDKFLWRRAKHVEVIPNFSSMPISSVSDHNSKRIIAVGRLGEDKGFDRLIDIWKIVYVSHPDWHLDIFGNGVLESSLKERITIENVNNIIIHNATPDISSEYANSSIFVLTSYYEGFSLVLLEAMRHGVPCIAFDCPFGPRNIIQDKKCGFLINDGDINLFAQTLNLFIENEKLRFEFSNAAIERGKDFNIDIIMNQWKCLFESLVGHI